MEVYDGNSETLYTAQCPQGSQFVVELLKIPCKRVISIKKPKKNLKNPEVGSNWVTRRSESYVLVATTTFISYRENRKYIQLTEGNSTGLTTDRVCKEFFVSIKSTLVLRSWSWRLFKKTNTTLHPQQQMYEHNISWQLSFKKNKECPLSQRILKHSRKKWLVRF